MNTPIITVVKNNYINQKKFINCNMNMNINDCNYILQIFYHVNCNKLGSGNGMGGLLIDKLYNPREMIITDMETHMSHINHNIKLNSGKILK